MGEERVEVLSLRRVLGQFRSERVEVSFEEKASQPGLQMLSRKARDRIFGSVIGEADMLWLAQLVFERTASSSQRS